MIWKIEIWAPWRPQCSHESRPNIFLPRRLKTEWLNHFSVGWNQDFTLLSFLYFWTKSNVGLVTVCSVITCKCLCRFITKWFLNFEISSLCHKSISYTVHFRCLSLNSISIITPRLRTKRRVHIMKQQNNQLLSSKHSKTY